MFGIALASDFSAVVLVIMMTINGQIRLLFAQKLIYAFAMVRFFQSALTFILGELSIHNVFVYNWCNLLEGVILALFYHHLFEKRSFKLFTLIGIVVAIAISFFDYQSLFDADTSSFNRFSYNVIGCLAIILVLLYFYQLIQRLQVPDLTKYPQFWFSNGALLYYSGTIFSYLFIEITFNSTIESRQQYWMIDAILSIVFNLFISLAIWYMKPAKTVG